jgi:hypothetical protein
VPHETSVWGCTTATGAVVVGDPDRTIFTDPVPRPGEQSKFQCKFHCPLATLKVPELPVPIPLSFRISFVVAAPDVGVTVVRVPPAGAMVIGGELEGAVAVQEATTTPDTENRRTTTTCLTLVVESLGIMQHLGRCDVGLRQASPDVPA